MCTFIFTYDTFLFQLRTVEEITTRLKGPVERREQIVEKKIPMEQQVRDVHVVQIVDRDVVTEIEEIVEQIVYKPVKQVCTNAFICMYVCSIYVSTYVCMCVCFMHRCLSIRS